MPEAVDREVVQVFIGEIHLEAAFEVLKSCFYIIALKRCYRCRDLIEIDLCH